MTTLPGSLSDLISRAEGKPIYCTAPGRVRRALVGAVIDTFRRDFPEAEFVNALAHYRHSDDRRRRWPQESVGYGGAIVVTRADDLPKDVDVFEGLVGEHTINAAVAAEIDYLAHRKRPIAWHAIVFPAAYWQCRFAVVPFTWLATGRWARLIPIAETEPFCPVVFDWLCPTAAPNPEAK